MSAKPGKKFPKKSTVTPANPVTPSTTESPPHPVPSPSITRDGDSVPAIEAADPQRRRLGQFVLIAVWIYVGALWLLALDQTFHWGIFGPPLPPLH